MPGDAHRRIPARAGWVEARKLPRGAGGNPLCRQCGRETPSRRRTFCGDACVHEWKIRTSPGYQAFHVRKRDRGVCESCGLDCVALLRELKSLRASERCRRFGADQVRHASVEASMPFDRNSKPLQDRFDELAMPRHLRMLDRRLWEMDHRIPVVEGGGSCGLDNLRTLCWSCHRSVTRELAKRRAEARRAG
jgi:5-methylcytosine-specific restriction endonuclease McrA